MSSEFTSDDAPRSAARRGLSGGPLVLVAVVAAVRISILVPRPASAQLCGLNNCGGSTNVSSLTVFHGHADDPNVIRVEPNTGETWTATVYWSTDVTGGGGCSCQLMQTNAATIRVDWSDGTASYAATCTAGCNAMSGPIFGVGVCTVDGCGEDVSIDHSWAYELILSVAKNGPLCNLAPSTVARVAWATTLVDNGILIDDECTHGDAVVPTTQVFAQNDNGPFDCTFTCAGASGPSIVLTYDDP